MIRLGTRRSRLATAQARIVADRLERAELVPISTEGDRDTARRFDEIGSGRGVFTRDIEHALLRGEVDAAVHSAKDLTGEMPAGLAIGAILERGDPRDAVCGPFGSLAEIPAGARVGTSSARRAGLLAELRPDILVVPLRGNVDTRLAKLDAGDADAIVLAAVGLQRLGLGERIAFVLDPAQFVPEAGQGAIAVQVRAGEEHIVAALDHGPTRAAVEAERDCVRKLGGGCTAAVAAHAWHEGGELRLRHWTAA
ncbi:MAG TPA: hydroxymethylbilane synthase [Gaiellales bacterium]|jgi:hydroxymethylbilane synthase|nr:hydroxymethylbilane synthase [Gaiellales bacterium]